MKQSFWTQFSLRTPLQSSMATSQALINDLRGLGLAESQWENFLDIIKVHHPPFSSEKTNTEVCGCLLSLNSCGLSDTVHVLFAKSYSNCINTVLKTHHSLQSALPIELMAVSPVGYMGISKMIDWGGRRKY